MSQFVAYYRVSTKHQGKDGNGIKAQRASVEHFLKDKDTLLDSFTEVESGTNGNRAVLKEAVSKCKAEGAKLLVAKLDRLSRNVKFLFTLKDELDEAGVGFTIANMPEAKNTMILGVMVSMAEHEAELISERTKAGIAQSEVYKSGNWGNKQNLTAEARAKAHKAVKRNARTDENTLKAFDAIQWRRKEGTSYEAIAKDLNTLNYRTRKGKKFHGSQVRRIWLRFTP
jgi:DNA invertase Pin-like site-specific DNA recombinase